MSIIFSFFCLEAYSKVNEKEGESKWFDEENKVMFRVKSFYSDFMR